MDIFRPSYSINFLTILISAVINTAVATEYTVTPLVDLGGGLSRGADISELGIIAGTSQGDSGGEQVDIATRWDSAGKPTRIDFNEQSFYTFGRAVNDQGVVVGFFDESRPALWQNGEAFELLSPDGSFRFGKPNDIDNNNVIVGCSGIGPVQWNNSVVAEVIPGTPNDVAGCAEEINSLGHITGTIRKDGINTAVIWKDLQMIELSKPTGFNQCYGLAINDSDHIVGYCRSDGTPGNTPYLWQNEQVIELPTLNGASGFVFDINNSGEILGFTDRSFVIQQGVVKDLSLITNSIFDRYESINNAGQIVGRNYLLTPTNISGPLPEPEPEPIPTPASADLSVSVIDSPDPARRNQLLTYQITVSNNSDDNADNVELISKISRKIELLSVTTSRGNCTGNQTITCSLNELRSGESAIVEVFVLPKKRRTLTNTVNISSSTNDPNLSNNEAIATTRIRR